MRRALVVAAVAVPFVVLAAVSASQGQVVEVDNFNATTGLSYINAAQCAGTATVDLEWNIKPISGGFTAGGTYKIFASNTAPPTTGTDPTVTFFCAEKSSTTPEVTAGPVDSDSANNSVQQKSVSAATIATVTGVACSSSNENTVVYVCSHWYAKDGVTKLGYSSGKFSIQVNKPGTPENITAESGDGELIVHWTASTTGAASDHFLVQAVGGGGTFSVTAGTGSETATIAGLVNGTAYTISVIAYSVGGNPSDPGTASEPATPEPAADFWDAYKAQNGRETGGCASGPAGALALLGTASLLAIRRRKP